MTATTDTRLLFGTGVSTGDLDLLVRKLRELHISHAKVGPVEVWLEREPAAVTPEAIWAELATPTVHPPQLDEVGGLTADEAEYIP